MFTASNMNSGHAFKAAATSKTANLPTWITGTTGGLDHTTSGQSITVAIPADFTGQIVLYCPYHSSMTLSIGVSSSLPDDDTYDYDI